MTIGTGSNVAGVETGPATAEAGHAPLAQPVPMPSVAARMFAPFRYMFRPRECGRVMASSPGWSVFAYFFGISLIGASALVASIVDQMVEYEWNFTSANSQGALRERGFIEAWQSLGTGLVSPATMTAIVFGAAVAWVLLATFVFAWISLPVAHRSGSALRSFARCLFTSAGIVGLGSFMVLGFGLLFALGSNMQEKALFGTPGASGAISSTLIFQVVLIGSFVATWVSIAILGYWTRLAATGGRSPESLPITPLTCEACGYDLTHVSEAGRCTECGTDARISLDPAMRRVGVEWERQKSLSAWVATNRMVISRPREFFQKIQMRRHEASAYAFARWNYFGIAVASIVSVSAMALAMQPFVNWDDLVAIVAVATIMSGVGAWLIHVAVGAIAATFTLVRRQSRPFAYLAKIWPYESALLWPLFFIGHALAWSFAMGDQWMTAVYRNLTGTRGLFVEGVVILVLAVVYLVTWLMRYSRAISFVRWANY